MEPGFGVKKRWFTTYRNHSLKLRILIYRRLYNIYKRFKYLKTSYRTVIKLKGRWSLLSPRGTAFEKTVMRRRRDGTVTEQKLFLHCKRDYIFQVNLNI
jgi:hypothetical protein